MRLMCTKHVTQDWQFQGKWHSGMLKIHHLFWGWRQLARYRCRPQSKHFIKFGAVGFERLPLRCIVAVELNFQTCCQRSQYWRSNILSGFSLQHNELSMLSTDCLSLLHERSATFFFFDYYSELYGCSRRIQLMLWHINHKLKAHKAPWCDEAFFSFQV